MHPLLDVKPWPQILLRYPLLILTALLLGALGAFAYSYAPLHSAKDWKIDYLEDRLEARNTHVLELEDELRQAKESLRGQASGDEVDALRAQLAEATELRGSNQKQTSALERKLESATRSRDSWKGRHAAATSELQATKASEAGTAASEPEVAAKVEPKVEPTGHVAAALDSPSALPASPAPVAPDADSAGDRLED